MRRDDLLVAVTLLDLLEEVLQTQTEGSTLRQPDRQTFTNHIGEHKELELLTDLTVVTFLGFFQEREVLIEHRAFWERDSVDTGHHRSFLIAAPIGSGAGEYLNRLDIPGAQEVRALTEIGEVTLGIGGNSAVLQLGDEFAFITLPLISKCFHSIRLRYLRTNDGLFLRAELHHLRLDSGEIGIFDDYSLGGHDVVIETALDSGSDTELDTRIEFLQRLRHEVGRGMPEGMFRLRVLPLESLNTSVLILYFNHICV